MKLFLCAVAGVYAVGTLYCIALLARFREERVTVLPQPQPQSQLRRRPRRRQQRQISPRPQPQPQRPGLGGSGYVDPASRTKLDGIDKHMLEDMGIARW